MLYPLLPLRVAAVVFYQGEADDYDAARYACSFPALIEDWREKFQSPQLPFYFVLLSASAPLTSLRHPVVSFSALIRLADDSPLSALCCSYRGGTNFTDVCSSQLAALALPFTGEASGLDLDDETSSQGGVHSRNKSHVGERLSRWLLRDVYHLSVDTQGPAWKTAECEMSVDRRTISGHYAYREEGRNGGLSIRAVPGCKSCCTNGTSLLTFQASEQSDAVYYATVALIGQQLSFKVTVPYAIGNRSIFHLQWDNYPECLLLQPAEPYENRLPFSSSSSSFSSFTE